MREMIDKVRALIPTVLLEWNRKRKKKLQRKALELQKSEGQIWTEERLVRSLKEAGVSAGKDLMVHSAMSKIGYLEEGPKTFVGALKTVLGPEATLLMPTSPVVTLQAKHELALFDVKETPSKMGAITEYFRAYEATHRSEHPLEPVAALGPKAGYYVQGHATDGTSYGSNSPWLKHLQQGGQLLYVGTTLINSGTSLHAIEDLIGWKNFKFPVYLDQSKRFKVKAADGRIFDVISKVHNPEVSAMRKCDGLIPYLENHGALRHVLIGDAPSLWVDGAKFKEVLLKGYEEKGITMYTPEGE
jgi:aminoglycoside 3-N-acetyltransferase